MSTRHMRVKEKKKMYSTKFQPLTIFAKDSILDV